MNKTVFIGFDPGSLRTGFGLVALMPNNTIKHLAHGTIILDKKKSPMERLMDLSIDVEKLLEQFAPTQAAIEDVFYCNHAHAALILGQARGVILGQLGRFKIKTSSLKPNEAKLIISGHGKAKKFQVAQFVSMQLSIATPSCEDASDALSIGLAAALRYRSNRA